MWSKSPTGAREREATEAGQMTLLNRAGCMAAAVTSVAVDGRHRCRLPEASSASSSTS